MLHPCTLQRALPQEQTSARRAATTQRQVARELWAGSARRLPQDGWCAVSASLRRAGLGALAWSLVHLPRSASPQALGSALLELFGQHTRLVALATEGAKKSKKADAVSQVSCLLREPAAGQASCLLRETADGLARVVRPNSRLAPMQLQPHTACDRPQ